MTFDEALSEAVLGARVTCDFIGEGVFVSYNFAGWRIHHGDMASSGLSWRDEHKAAEWRIVEDEVPKPVERAKWHTFEWAKKRIDLGEAGVPRVLDVPPVVDRKLAADWKAAQASNVGTKVEPPSGLALARLERAKAAEPLPETPAPAKPWGAPAAKPWGPGK